ncbi:MAG: COX15/CtaA family protein, partial [Candidatus Marinimicrobia bacterium]|nr:COX15/CtaA family protein [Candidatus Neomarinimicrobiota bacterium]
MTVGATFILLVIGGLVSSKGVGMAVPDWPTTFGENMFTFPFSKMVGGIFYEHSHRLMGSLVGFLTIGLTSLIWWKEERRWLKWLSVIALISVIFQGIMGGLRVIEISTFYAVAHGAFAHLFFALIVSIALFLTDYWRTA